jgi:hypothetical protein
LRSLSQPEPNISQQRPTRRIITRRSQQIKK